VQKSALADGAVLVPESITYSQSFLNGPRKKQQSTPFWNNQGRVKQLARVT
jgi:hypothetical protein